jgi:EAL domain-containing protein (putative c-di-GMP-specific phosphodiesterase class I)/GGDEF domain-containing protein
LPNRQRLKQILTDQVEWAMLRQSGVATLMLDVDNFSRINDTQGPAAGDAVLKEVASRLQHCLRDCDRTQFDAVAAATAGVIKDCVARTGGDEFGLVLPGVSTADAADSVARRVQLALARPFIIADQEYPLSAAIGISVYPLDAADAESLINNADAAMHHAKKAHVGGMEFFKKSISTRAAKRMSLESHLRKAVERQEFVLHYQPRLSLETLQVEAVEALLRWPHPQRGLVPPDEFIPIAEQSGLIVEIGDWVLREACAQAKRWQDTDTSSWQVAVNVSGVQFRDGSLVRRVEHAIASAGIDPRVIELEFTEGALIEYSSAVSKAVTALKELGVATALDDFGTGYSSMSYLRHFPVDTLKIDRLFVRDIASRTAGNAPLVDAIIAMAKSLGLATVAEGVETNAQWQYLTDRDVDQVQGYLFCKPLSVIDLERWHTDWLLSNQHRGAAWRRASASGGFAAARRRQSQRWSAPVAPEYLAARFVAREHARQHEEQIREAVQVLERIGSDILDARQRPGAALGAAAHRACHVAGGSCRAAARQNELLERRQGFVEGVELALEPLHIGRRDHAVPRNAELAAEVEQIVLHLGEAAPRRFGQPGDGEHHADGAIRLVHRTVGFDPQAFLRDPAAVAEARGPVIARPGVNLAQPIAHARLLA